MSYVKAKDCITITVRRKTTRRNRTSMTVENIHELAARHCRNGVRTFKDRERESRNLLAHIHIVESDAPASRMLPFGCQSIHYKKFSTAPAVDSLAIRTMISSGPSTLVQNSPVWAFHTRTLPSIPADAT